jgi:hypothetical protein
MRFFVEKVELGYGLRIQFGILQKGHPVASLPEIDIGLLFSSPAIIIPA